MQNGAKFKIVSFKVNIRNFIYFCKSSYLNTKKDIYNYEKLSYLLVILFLTSCGSVPLQEGNTHNLCQMTKS